MNLPNLPSLSNKVRSSALFITGTTSSFFIAEDFLKMSKLEMDQADYMERDACGIRASIDKAVREYVPRASESAVGPWVSAVWPATARANGNPTKIK
jgi:hypothetical protein